MYLPTYSKRCSLNKRSTEDGFGSLPDRLATEIPRAPMMSAKRYHSLRILVLDRRSYRTRAARRLIIAPTDDGWTASVYPGGLEYIIPGTSTSASELLEQRVSNVTS
jgi:hypothetical protein